MDKDNMNDKENTGPSLEDNDEFVLAIEALPEPAEVLRKPGLAIVRLAVAGGRGTITVTRSRFSGVYGNICRMTFEDALPGNSPIVTTFAPTVAVVAALRSSVPEQAIENLFKEWVTKGR